MQKSSTRSLASSTEETIASGLAGSGTRLLHAMSCVGQQFGCTSPVEAATGRSKRVTGGSDAARDSAAGPGGNRVRPHASGAQLPAPGPGLGQRRSHRPPRLLDSHHGYALVVLAARLLLEAGGREPAAGTP